MIAETYRLTELDDLHLCCVCGHLTPRGQVISGIVVGWCDFDWHRWGDPALIPLTMDRYRRTV